MTMNDNPLKKILIIDDDLVMQSFLQDFLSQNNFEIFSLLEGEEIEGFLEKETVDLILLDVLLPGENGYHWLEWLNDNYDDIPVLMLSVKGECDDRVYGLEMGARDYLVKPADPRELLARINNLFRCDSAINKNDTAVTFGEFVFEIERSSLSCEGENIRLTTTEAQLLNIFCRNINKTLSRDELTLSLRGNQHNPYDRSIDVHINRLRNKIEDLPAEPRYLLTTWGKGYRFVTGD